MKITTAVCDVQCKEGEPHG